MHETKRRNVLRTRVTMGLIFLMLFLTTSHLVSATQITAKVDSNGVLMIAVTAGEKVKVHCDKDGYLKVNDFWPRNPSGHSVKCKTIKKIVVAGSTKNDNIDLGAVSQSAFPNLDHTEINTKGGNDNVVGAGVRDVIHLGPGEHVVTPGEGDDEIYCDGGTVSIQGREPGDTVHCNGSQEDSKKPITPPVPPQCQYYEPSLVIQNPGNTDATVTMTYWNSDGTTMDQALTVPSNSRQTVNVAESAGTCDASVTVSSSVPILAERPMYFNYRGNWCGHSTIGVTSPGTTWYFAEGTTSPGFETWLCIQNQADTQASVNVTYMTSDGKVPGPALTVPPNSRQTVNPADSLGSCDFSATVTSDQPIIAERAMYFNYEGNRCGGSTMGATSPSTTWYLAEGTTRPGFETWLLIQNPGHTQANVSVTYMTSDGKVPAPALTVPPKSRQTVNPADTLGSCDFSTTVTSDQPIIAERAMYFNYEGNRCGGSTMGVASPSTTWYFAEGTTRPGFETWLLIQNPGHTQASVNVTYMTPDGKVPAPALTVPPNSRQTVNPGDSLGSCDFSTRVTSDQPIIAERAMYFNYEGNWLGGSTVGMTTPSTTWYMPQGVTTAHFEEPKQVDEGYAQALDTFMVAAANLSLTTAGQLKEKAHSLFDQAMEQGVDVSEVADMLAAVDALLEVAQEYATTDPVAAISLAKDAARRYGQIISDLEALLE